MPLSPRGCLRTGPFSSSSITAVVHTVPSMFDTTLTAFAVLCTAMLTSAHPGSMICNDPRLTEGGNMMHAFVTINNHQTDLLLEANATQYKVIIYIYITHGCQRLLSSLQLFICMIMIHSGGGKWTNIANRIYHENQQYGETILITIKANGTRYVSQDAPMGVYLALQVRYSICLSHGV